MELTELYYTVCVFSKCGVDIYSRIGNKGLYFPTFFQFLFFHFFFFCFLLHNISTYLLKNCFVMFLFYHIINHFCLSYSYEKNSFFYELKVQYHLWLIRSFGVYAYCICICQGHIRGNSFYKILFILKIQVGYISL